jgi:hypothetical protein
MEPAYRVIRPFAVCALFGLACLGCPPPPDDRELVCDDYCEGLLSCDEGWEIGIYDEHDCSDTCYYDTTLGELDCVDAAAGCDDVRRCLCYPLYLYLYEECDIYFTDAAGYELYLEDAVAACEGDDWEFGFGSPIADCLVDEGSCGAIDACLDALEYGAE